MNENVFKLSPLERVISHMEEEEEENDEGKEDINNNNLMNKNNKGSLKHKNDHNVTPILKSKHHPRSPEEKLNRKSKNKNTKENYDFLKKSIQRSTSCVGLQFFMGKNRKSNLHFIEVKDNTNFSGSKVGKGPKKKTSFAYILPEEKSKIKKKVENQKLILNRRYSKLNEIKEVKENLMISVINNNNDNNIKIIKEINNNNEEINIESKTTGNTGNNGNFGEKNKNKKRIDHWGNEISKKNKKNVKVYFNTPFSEVNNIESFKKYNIIERTLGEDYAFGGGNKNPVGCICCNIL